MGRTTRCSGFRFLVDFGLFVGSSSIQAHRESWILLASESVSTSVSPTLVHQDSEPVASSGRLSSNQSKFIRRNSFVVLPGTATISVITTQAFIVVARDCRGACARVRAINERLTAAADMANLLACGQLWIEDVRSWIELLLMRTSELVVSSLKKNGKSFFEKRVSEYRERGALSWDYV